MWLFKSKPKSCLGIDIGTSSIKVVQLKREDERYKLETYGELQVPSYSGGISDSLDVKASKLPENQIIDMIQKLLKDAETKTKHVIMSIPVFSAFISVIDLPPMSEKEISRALIFEAKRYIPVSLSEVRIDWKIISKEEVSSTDSKNKGLFKFRAILVAVPKEIIGKYLRIVSKLKLKILALELESFSYIRSLVGSDPSTACVLDFGARSTSFTIVDKGLIQMSHSFDIAGNELTKALSHGMGVDFSRAEAYKRERGLDHMEVDAGKEIKDILLTFIDKVVLEMERMMDAYFEKSKRKVTKLVLSGGSGSIVGLKEYLSDRLKIEILIGNPWARVSYPTVLSPVLKEIAPRFAVAIGLAMREI